MTLLTEEEISASWGPLLADMTSMQRSTYHRPSSSQATQTASVSCYTLFLSLDGPSDHVNERAVQFDTTVVALSNCVCKGLCHLP